MSDAESIIAQLRSMMADQAIRDLEMRKIEEAARAAAADAGLRIKPTFGGLEVQGGSVPMAKLKATIDLHNLVADHRKNPTTKG